MKSSERPRGVAIPVVMLILLMVIGFTVASGLVTSQNYTNAAGRERTLQAQYAFRAGVATAMERLTKGKPFPHTGYLDENEGVGFEISLEGINLDSDTPITVNGRTLARGQAAIQVVPLVNGQAVAAGFAGAEAGLVLMRPPARFEQNILHSSEDLPLTLRDNSKYYSYDSDGTVAATSGFPDYSGSPAPPLVNQEAVVRSVSTLRANDGVVVYGGVGYPEADVKDFIRSVTADVTGGRHAFDGLPAPMIFTPPDDTYETAPDQTVNVDTVFPLTPVATPVARRDLTVMPGVTLTLQRGQTYAFRIFELRAGAKLNLTGPGSEPCVVYTPRIMFYYDSIVNMPSSPSDSPKPADLQIYLVPNQAGTSVVTLYDRVQIAAVIGGYETSTFIHPDVKLFGAFYGRLQNFGSGLESHFDKALLGEVLEGKTEWVVVNQGW